MEKKAFADDNELALEIATNLETERVKLATQEITVKKSVTGEEARTTLKSKWVAKIIEPGAVPRAYCVPDEKLLNRLAKENHDFKIAGVIFEEVFGLASSKI